MEKPKFEDLPHDIRKRLLWEMDLNYCPYESSMAEAIHYILNGNSYSNEEVIKEYYEKITIDRLKLYLEQQLVTLKQKIEDTERWLKKLCK